jgi:hypothetical protein
MEGFTAQQERVDNRTHDLAALEKVKALEAKFLKKHKLTKMTAARCTIATTDVHLYEQLKQK